MDKNQRPRHIRDIAHLYLSRMPAGGRGADARRILVTAVSRDCFSAYHAANLALGIARRGMDVELIEMSGVLPCAAYFLRMPPKVYLRHKTQSPGESLSALGGVSLRFSLDADSGTPQGAGDGITTGERRRRTARVTLFHLPLANRQDLFDAALLRVMGTGAGAGARALVLAPDESMARETGRRLFGGRQGVEWKTLSLEKRITTADRLGIEGHSLGYLTGWRALLNDRVPCVLRDPQSHVARSYLSVCDVLAAAGSNVKERNDGKTTPRRASFGQFR